MTQPLPDTPLSASGGPYAGRQIWLTTMHGKERALARSFRAGLGAELRLHRADTDQLGTFSGEVERPGDAITTCRAKAELGLEATGQTLGLASEGSFGPHPAIPFLAVGQEVLVFIDRERRLTVVEQRLEPRTTFASRSLRLAELDSEPMQRWLALVRFPSHGLIVRPEPDSAAGPSQGQCMPQSSVQGPCFKGIHEPRQLEQAMRRCAGRRGDGLVRLESDMRAHCNPTRMASIRRLGFQLVRRLRQPCPACGSPGWGPHEGMEGLPCRSCGTPTPLIAAERWACPACDHSEQRPRRDGRQLADPMHCLWCNP